MLFCQACPCLLCYLAWILSNLNYEHPEGVRCNGSCTRIDRSSDRAVAIVKAVWRGRHVGGSDTGNSLLNSVHHVDERVDDRTGKRGRKSNSLC